MCFLQFLMTTNSLTTCCESSGRTLSDSAVAASAQTPVYCPVYDSRLLATARHELSSAAALGVYGNPYTTSQGYGNYVTYGTDASAFYSLVSISLISSPLIITTALITVNTGLHKALLNSNTLQCDGVRFFTFSMSCSHVLRELIGNRANSL